MRLVSAGYGSGCGSGSESDSGEENYFAGAVLDAGCGDVVLDCGGDGCCFALEGVECVA